MIIGPAGFQHAPRAQSNTNCHTCGNCANWKRISENRGKCSEPRADKISPNTVQDYSCRYQTDTK